MLRQTEDKLIYFVSGMWCATCAKSIQSSVRTIGGVRGAEVNYVSKLLTVDIEPQTLADKVDSLVCSQVERIGFSLKKQSDDWVESFKKDLAGEQTQRLSWLRVGVVWFLAMWTSMIAFSGYMGGLDASSQYLVAVVVSAFGMPAIVFGIAPYARSGLRALYYSHLVTMDLVIFLGGASATLVSLFYLFSLRPETYADSAAMVVAFLLLTKKIENWVAQKMTSEILFQIHPKSNEVEVLKGEIWKTASPSQIRIGDLVRVAQGSTVEFDGRLESETATLNNHLISGEDKGVSLLKGDDVHAGAIAKTPLMLKVLHPLGKRRIDAWAERALLASHKGGAWARFFSRMESFLVFAALSGAFLVAGIQFLRGGSTTAVIESFFIAVLVFCPCLFASIIPLAGQMAHLALHRRGIDLFRSNALLDLTAVKNVYLDKTGTLEAVESRFLPFEEESAEMKTLISDLLSELSEKSAHPLLRGFRKETFSSVIAEFHELAGRGLQGKTFQGMEFALGRASFLEERGIRVPEKSTAPLVAVGGRVLGKLLVKKKYDESAKKFLKALLNFFPQGHFEILSGDPSPGVGAAYTTLSPRLHFYGNLSPEEKALRVEDKSLFIGDGLNDVLALSRATVGIRLGNRVVGFAPVDVHVKLAEMGLILDLICYAKKFRRVLIQTALAALTYNGIALSFAALGYFRPLTAVLAMTFSFALLLASSTRLLSFKGEKT
jgi:P-type E1-E2 ATPase